MKILTSIFSLVLLFYFICIPVQKSDGKESQSETHQKALLNYITKSFLPDGGSEIHMRFGEVTVREASIAMENKAGKKTDLKLRQLASGPHLLQSIYKVEEGRASERETMVLIECEMINDWGTADQFRNHFHEDLRRAGLNLPVPPNTLDHLKSKNDHFNVDELEPQQEMELPKEVVDLNQGQIFGEFRNVTVRAIRNEEVSGELQHSFDLISQQRQCRRLPRKMNKAASNNKNDLETNTSNRFNDSDSATHNVSRRFRREAFRVGIMPGTLWCGEGSLANRYEEMEAHVGTDRCCRQHDGCPFIIEGMTSNYGLFNFRMQTLSHCTCDERFRSCLKQTNTGASNFVGRLFFNMVQSKCFVLKPEKHCARRSWLGRCVKFEYRKQAHLRNPIPY